MRATSVDIRTPPPPDEPTDAGEGKKDAAAAKERARLVAIRELAARIRRLDTPSTRILQLPESAGDQPNDDRTE
jgi:hypothetical protein